MNNNEYTRLAIYEAEYAGIISESQRDQMLDLVEERSNIEWKYISKIEDKSMFDEIGKMYNIHFPMQLKSFFKKYNGGTPHPYGITVKDKERVFAAVLSVNKNGEGDKIYPYINRVKSKGFIPVAIDPFGNCFCYEISTKKMVFFDHETNKAEPLGCGIGGIISRLH